jgi:hypothetical protein
MDIYNIKMNDNQWRRSWHKMQDLESLLNQNNNRELKEAIQDPELAVGYC